MSLKSILDSDTSLNTTASNPEPPSLLDLFGVSRPPSRRTAGSAGCFSLTEMLVKKVGRDPLAGRRPASCAVSAVAGAVAGAH